MTIVSLVMQSSYCITSDTIDCITVFANIAKGKRDNEPEESLEREMAEKMANLVNITQYFHAAESKRTPLGCNLRG